MTTARVCVVSLPIQPHLPAPSASLTLSSPCQPSYCDLNPQSSAPELQYTHFPLPECSSLRSLQGLILCLTQVSAQSPPLRSSFLTTLSKIVLISIIPSLTLLYFLPCTCGLGHHTTDLFIYLFIYCLPMME